ncbi:MAG: hypothetical protein ACQESU_02740 [Halobacteriota archaeon]
MKRQDGPVLNVEVLFVYMGEPVPAVEKRKTDFFEIRRSAI